jgi:hypothetical protein
MSFLGKILRRKKSTTVSKDSVSDLDKLTNVKDRWTMAETLKSMAANPNQGNLETIEKAINMLTKGDFTPYRKKIDPLDPNSACQGILYYARADVFKTDPYAVQALIPYVGSQADFLSRQLRSMENGDWYYAIYQLLEAQLGLSQRI